MTIKLTARRNGPDFDLFFEDMTVPFARLAACEGTYVFLAHQDEELQECVDYEIKGDMSAREMLALVRVIVDDLERQRLSAQEGEIWAENAWLRAAEAGDPETWAEEDRAREIDAYAY